MAEATEAATTQTEAQPSPEATVTTETNLLGDPVKTETTDTDPAKTPAAETKPAEPAKQEGAPEKYEFKAPEGKEYDSGLLDAFSIAAKDSNLSQDAAQKLLDTMSPKIAERQLEQVVAIRKGWVEETRADKELGGVHLETTLATAKKAYDKFASPELKALLDSTGLGNHREVVRMFNDVGKAFSEDTFVGGAPANTRKNLLEVLYDKTPKES